MGIVDRLKGVWKAIRPLVDRAGVEREMDEEMAFHVEMETAKNIRGGMSSPEAKRAALLAFRGVDRYKEEVRAARSSRWIETARQDLHAAVRTIRGAPGLAVVVVLTLSLGIGSVTAIFGVVDAAILQPLPWPDADRLVLVRETTPEGSTFPVAEPNYLDFRGANRSLAELAAFRQADLSLTGEGDPERVRGLAVTHTLFPLLGSRAALGRTFRPEEDRAGGDDRVVILGHDLWARRFGGDPGVVDRSILLDGVSYRVVGVMPEGFEFRAAEAWVPLAPDPRSDRDDHWLDVVGRLTRDGTLAQAEAELGTIAQSIGAGHPEVAGWGVELRTLEDWIVGPEVRRAGAILLGAAALFLLIACANVANLLLAHATTRRGDLGVRIALGAGRARLARQLLTESLVLSLAGAGAGLLGAAWALDAVRAAPPGLIPRVDQVGMDARVAMFAVGLAVMTAVVFGSIPALQAARTDAAAQLKEGARTGASGRERRVRDWLVVTQVAVAVVLLVGSGLMVRSYARLQAVDPGFRTQNVWTAPIQLPQARYPDEYSQFTLYRDVLDRVRAVPGVAAVGATVVDPFGGLNLANDVTPEERAAEAPGGFTQAAWRTVSPGYFEALEVPLLRGRLFTADDRYGNPATVVITRTLAQRLWPGEDPIGRRLFWGGTEGEPRTVIGMVGDVQDVALEADPPPLMFLSYRQLVLPMMTLVVRTSGDVPGLASAVRAAIWEVDPSLPVPVVRPLADNRAGAVAAPRFRTWVMGSFAALALILAGVGLYGLLGFVVAQRTREIGVRRALGADSPAISRMVVRRGLILAGAGTMLGLAGAVALSRLIESLLFRTGVLDPITLLAVPAIFGLVAVVASWIPARRASRVDPMIAIRAE